MIFIRIVAVHYTNNITSGKVIIKSGMIYEDAVIGGCNIKIFQDSPHVGEIGYFIDRNFFNRGIATEVVKELENIAFNDLKLIRLEIRMDPRNK
ncbi:MAG TPA: hypothetical protein DCR69_10090, partial [Clostridium sp.]|nr:hypothetical protein [Clostridium sp.]